LDLPKRPLDFVACALKIGYNERMRKAADAVRWPAPPVRAPEPQPERNIKGEGSVFRRADGYWIYQLKEAGHTYSKSLGQVDEATARKKAVAAKRAILGKIVRGEDTPRDASNVTVGDITERYIDYAKRNLKSSNNIEKVLRSNIEKSPLWHMRAAAVGTRELEAYRRKREAEGAKAATINNELSYLRAAYYRAKKKHSPPLVKDIPAFPIEHVDNKRAGFLPDEGYKLVLNELPDFAKLVFVLAFHLGCRRSEILRLQWSKVHLDGGFIDLEKTKNGEDRRGPIYGDMLPWLKWQKAIRDKRFPNTETVIFFHHDNREASGGDPVGQFYGSWNSAVERAGYTSLLLHDLRRTACRNMVQKARIPQVQAMRISGHVTDSMFRRYNIADPAEIVDIGKRIEKWSRKAVGTVAPPEIPDEED
jgi:integrase